MKILQLRFIMTALAAMFDPFEEVLWVSIPEVGRTEDITTSADRLIAVVRALLWEALFCAVPHINNAWVEIEVDCVSHTANYRIEILPNTTDFIKWDPELHRQIATTTVQIKKDIVSMLADLAEAYFSNTDGGGNPRYEIRKRD